MRDAYLTTLTHCLNLRITILTPPPIAHHAWQVNVLWFTLFARSKSVNGGPDLLRAVAEDVVHRELRSAGFFDAGGRLVDQWPLYGSYFRLVDKRVASFGPSSLHCFHSATRTPVARLT